MFKKKKKLFWQPNHVLDNLEQLRDFCQRSTVFRVECKTKQIQTIYLMNNFNWPKEASFKLFISFYGT